MFEFNYSAPCLRRNVCRKIWKEFQNGKGWLSVLWRFHLSKCVWGFPGGSVENAGDVRLIPGVRIFPWRRKWKPTPVFLPGQENPMDRRAWQAIVHGVAKRWTWLSNWVRMHTWSTYLYLSIYLSIYEQYEKAKRYSTERWTLRSVGAQNATGEEWRNNSRKNEEIGPKQKERPVVDVTGDGSKVWCSKEQYCIGTWMLGPWIKVNWKWSNRRWQEWIPTF